VEITSPLAWILAEDWSAQWSRSANCSLWGLPATVLEEDVPAKT